MKINGWTIIGYVCGSMFSLLSAIRYYLLYTDLDKAITYIIIGVIICAVAWLYNKQQTQGNEIEAISEYLADKKIK